MQFLTCGTHLRLLGPVAWGGTQLPLSARQQWMPRNLLKFPTEESNGMGGDRARNLTATSQSAQPLV